MYQFLDGIKGSGPLGFQPGIAAAALGDKNYSPMWRIFMVSWDDPSKAMVLETMDDINELQSEGLINVNLARPMNSVHIVNCPFIDPFQSIITLQTPLLQTDKLSILKFNYNLAGKLFIVGVGPGHHDHMTYRAKKAIEESDTIVGYETYVNLVQDLIDGKDVYRYAMTQEVERAKQCIETAKEGKSVSLVSSGDPGIYGMAGLIYETLAEQGWDPKSGLQVEIIPGVSALNSCASIIGSPLIDKTFAVLSMSDLLVPWEIIIKRVEAAALGDFVIVIYNPASKKRIHQLQDTRKILLKYRKPSTPVANIKRSI